MAVYKCTVNNQMELNMLHIVCIKTQTWGNKRKYKYVKYICKRYKKGMSIQHQALNVHTYIFIRKNIKCFYLPTKWYLARKTAIQSLQNVAYFSL